MGVRLRFFRRKPMQKDRTHQVFETALDNAKPSSAIWPTQYCEDIDTVTMLDFEKEIKNCIRGAMEAANRDDQFLFQLDKYDSYRGDARRKLDDGQVAAVDGTNALELTPMMSTSAYAVAVGYLTSRNRGNPHITVTTTNTKYINRAEISRQDIGELCDELDEIRVDESWPTTFREYQERRVAMSCGADIVLIDGPVWTQNLVSQNRGREIYREMDASRSSFIGVIKNIAGSWTMSKWCGYSLKPGEGFVVGRIKSQFQTRFKKHGDVLDWVNQMPDDYVRVVYRPKQKAFAFECRLTQLSLAVALLLEDASPTKNHEIPQLLELIDAQIRASFHGGNARQLVISKIQRDNYQMGIDVTNERDYR